MVRLEISLLGPPEIKVDGNPVKTDRRKAIALLSYLAVTGKFHTRDHLAALLWPDYERSSAYAYLRRTLWELNQILGKGWIKADREHVSLEQCSDLWLDSAAFLEMIQPGLDGIAVLTDAVELYRGDFLAGFTLADTAPFEDWQFQQVEYFRREFAETLERLVDAHARVEEYEAALPHTRRWLALDPLNESAHRAIMHLLAKMGDRTGAIRQYETCAQTLKDELGIPPQQETTKLYEAILHGDIRGIPSNQTASPPIEGPSPVSRIPVMPTTFIGRRPEVEQVKALIMDPTHRLINLIGPGGIGKTRLSIQAVSEVGESFLDGAFFVPLAPVQSAEAVLPTIAKALQVSFFHGDMPPRQQFLDYLREKRLLLLLDNFEHLLEASELVAEILMHADNVKIVVTSRIRLNLQGEQLYPVSGMRTADIQEASTWENPEEQSKPFSGVQLFLERARRVKPNFALTKENISNVIKICQLVQGMPLGLELAAAWLELLTPGEITAEINRSLDFLETDLTDVPDRQRSIRAVFESSWTLLSKEEQDIFLSLCVFTGSFSRTAAQRVSGASLRSLLGLANKSWVQQTDQGRFQLHELMRQYGVERLRANESTWRDAKDRHAAYFIDFVIEQTERMRSSEQVDGVKALLDEYEGNVKSTWDWLVSERRWTEIIEHIAPALCQFSLIRWQEDEFIPWFRAARLALEAESKPEERLAFVTISTIEIYCEEAGAIKDADPIRRLASIWEMVNQYNLAEEMGLWYILLASMAYACNIISKQDEKIEVILHQLREKNKSWQLGFSLLLHASWWGGVEFTSNDAILLEAAQIFNEMGVIYEQGSVAELLGRHAFQHRQTHAEVIRYYDRARQFFRQLNGVSRSDVNMFYLADVYFYQGDSDKGFALFHEEQKEYKKLGQMRLVLSSQNWEGLYAARYSTFEHTISLRQSSLELAQKLGGQSDYAWHLFEMGDAYRIFGDPKIALSYYDQARPLFEKMNMIQGLSFDQRGRGDLALQEGRYADALDYYQRFREYSTEDNHHWGMAQAEARIALAQAYLGDLKESRQELIGVLANLHNWRAVDLTLQSLLAEPICLVNEGNLEKAIELASLIKGHVASWNETKQKASEILETAAEGLPVERVQAAIDRGNQLDLDSVVTKFEKRT